MILFRTMHGSNLYNLAHAGSDQDYFTVIANRPRRRSRYARQSIAEGVDNLTMDLSTFMRYCDMGVHQSLEAMFSPCIEESKIEGLRRAYRINMVETRIRYMRTIKSFASHNEFKRRRHAFRLCLNLTEAMERGRFNPRLTAEKAAEITAAASRPDYLKVLEGMLPYELDLA